MSLNCAEIDKIIENIPVNSIIRSFTQSVNNELYINLTTNEGSSSIYISIIDSETGIFLLPHDFIKNVPQKKQKLSSMLDSRLKGGRITEISQPTGSRIVIISIKLFENTFKLIGRLWGTGSNILITDEDYLIIDLLKRYPNRGEWPKEKFIIPSNKSDRVFTVRNELIKTSVNDDLFHYYRNLKDNRQFNIKYNQLLKIIDDELSSTQNQIENTEINIKSDKHSVYKKYGDLISSSIYQISKGMENIKLIDFETDKEIIVPLDSLLPPQENALKYYDKYKKIKTGIKIWEEQLSQYNEKLSLFDAFKARLTNAKSLDELNKLEIQLNRKKSVQKQLSNIDKKLPGRKVYLSDGFIAYISRSSKEADELLKITARGNDYWFHIRDNTGSHVVVKNRQTIELSDKARLEAAMLALHFSKSKEELEGDIYFTRVKYLHKPNNNTQGLVFPTREKNIKVKKNQNIIDILLKSID